MPQPHEPLIVDVEASGFGGDSYPIEIGLALEDGSKFCTLIAPAPDWTHWDDDAETVHRISRDILETYGKPMQDVANFLNDILAGKTVYTDGWVVDKPWLTRLFHAAGVEMDFTVSSLEMILSPEQMEVWHDTKDQVVEDMELKRHRASYHALIIQETYKRTLQQ
ncbi:MAG: hypothetical protein ISP91_16725 [Pseudomonadales bacterium]|nr:hypothetical protein [Pseudomonadales bacterium]